MMKGVWHKIMRVDLTTGQSRLEDVPDKVYEYFLGGGGLGAYILWKECPAGTKPFDPENRLIFATGPFQGQNQTGAAKWTAVTIGPQFNANAESCASASWGIEMKSCGFDAIVIQGKAPHPVYLSIVDDKVEIKDARNMWGRDAYETDDMITEIEGPKSHNITIGQAGENLVRIANVQTHKKSFLGRGGFGAIMGSKNLKGVSVQGSNPSLSVANPEELKRISRQKAKDMLAVMMAKPVEAQLCAVGTAIVTRRFASQGNLPIKNYSLSELDYPEVVEAWDPLEYMRLLNSKPWPCKYCVTRCHNLVEIPEGKYAYKGKGPEYESYAMMGLNLLSGDVRAVAYAGELANKLSMDTISLGSVLAWAMESYEKGVITKEDTYGIELEWGNMDAAIEMIYKIAERAPGLGYALGEGTGYAASVYGKGSEDWAVQMKGTEIAAHSWRAQYISALNYATGCSSGPNHERGNSQHIWVAGLRHPEWGLTDDTVTNEERWTWENASYRQSVFQDYCNIINSIVHCKFQEFLGYTLTDMLNTLNAITGLGWTQKEFRRAGERITTLQKLLTIRYGWKKEDDLKFPKRFMEPVDKGVAAGKVPIGLEDAIVDYYKYRGWDENGIPTRELIERLGMEEYASTEEIYS
jgi:aldehyde:ferredoxin oxidoreductase